MANTEKWEKPATNVPYLISLGKFIRSEGVFPFRRLFDSFEDKAQFFHFQQIMLFQMIPAGFLVLVFP